MEKVWCVQTVWADESIWETVPPKLYKSKEAAQKDFYNRIHEAMYEDLACLFEDDELIDDRYNCDYNGECWYVCNKERAYDFVEITCKEIVIE